MTKQNATLELKCHVSFFFIKKTIKYQINNILYLQNVLMKSVIRSIQRLLLCDVGCLMGAFLGQKLRFSIVTPIVLKPFQQSGNS